jgi:hypothetical protein
MSKLGTLGALLFLAAIPAQAQEVIFGANVGGRWDSNVNNVPNGDSAFSARVGPEVQLVKEQGDLTYNFHYVPTYQAFNSKFSSLDDWDHLFNSFVGFQLGSNTTLQFHDLFEYAPVATNFLEQLPSAPVGTPAVTSLGRFNVLINSATVDLHHSWTELWLSDASVSSFYYDPKIQNGVTTNNTSANGSLTYAWTPRDFVGASLGFTAQQFGSSSTQGASTNYFYNASALWNHDFSPTWSLKMQAGPTYVDTPSPSNSSTALVPQFPTFNVGGQQRIFNFNACPLVPSLGPNRSILDLCIQPPTLFVPNGFVSSTVPVPVQGLTQGSQTSITYFANIQMLKRWETVTGSIGFSRSAGTSGVFSTSTVSNTVNGTLTWTASPVWTTSLNVYWVDQSSTENHFTSQRLIIEPGPTTPPVTEAAGILLTPQSGTINVYQWIIGLHSDYKVTKRLSVFGNFYFLNQSSSQQGLQGFNLSSLNYDATRIDVGLHYEFDPIYL